LIIPNWGFEKIAKNTTSYFPYSFVTTYEFDNEEKLNAVVETYDKKAITSSNTQSTGDGEVKYSISEVSILLSRLLSRSEYIAQTFEFYNYLLFGVSVFLLIAAMLNLYGFISKLILENHYEIGVMRAIGAYKKTIAWLYILYSGLLIVSGFFVGLGLAFMATIVLSLMFGEAVFYTFLPFANSGNITQPWLVFTGFRFLKFSEH
jgi:ABC-type antimicrobial peptide transport system permease subunit